ncbi:hypothetical protein ABW20_dc0103594 [Dactylellina cionopaga]|nr:hypothetical protein ABW20_dc0103594 [Dactylellina cionopaga]
MITQDRGAVFELKVREFIPPDDEMDARDIRGNPMYAVPWAVENVEETVKSFHTTITESIGRYLGHILDDSDFIIWNVFKEALRLSSSVSLLKDVLRLWVICRCTEGGMRLCGEEDHILHHESQRNKARGSDWLSTPSYADYQMAAIMHQRFLFPLGAHVLRNLEKMIVATREPYPEKEK